MAAEAAVISDSLQCSNGSKKEVEGCFHNVVRFSCTVMSSSSYKLGPKEMNEGSGC